MHAAIRSFLTDALKSTTGYKFQYLWGYFWGYPTLSSESQRVEYPKCTRKGTLTCSSHSSTVLYKTYLAGQEESGCVLKTTEILSKTELVKTTSQCSSIIYQVLFIECYYTSSAVAMICTGFELKQLQNFLNRVLLACIIISWLINMKKMATKNPCKEPSKS